MADKPDPDDAEPEAAEDTGPVPAGPVLLTDDEVAILTTARTLKWRLEVYEYAYDVSGRRLYHLGVLLRFLGAAVAILFLYFRLITSADPELNKWLGHAGTGFSILLLLGTIWGAFARWTDQIAKKKELSREARQMIVQHRQITEERPVKKSKVQKWIVAAESFDEDRKHELATVDMYYLQQGHQHVCNLNPMAGIKCMKCDRIWTPAMNKRAKWIRWVPFLKCDNCGV